ncbi:MAG: MBL fold metallo-hydrolase [Candidatus Aenigmarchaeota archaeon]|nr:MBL fold metallo-hydrolase [Candidatus Aenigmarchaeota archaeon]
MVTITGLGGFREVGRSAILVEGSQRFLLDYGLSVQDLDVPAKPPAQLDGVFMSHAHLDHCGIAPELYKRGYAGKTYGTPATFELMRLMLDDELKVHDKRAIQPFFSPHDIDTLERHSQAAGFKKPIHFRQATATFTDAGHVPGSAATLIEMDGKRILYTGDINFTETELMHRADDNLKDIDLLICESTYTKGDHPDRKVLREELVNHVLDVVHNNGIVLMPCFSIGRTQELLQIVADLDVPILLDGMGMKATSIITNHPEAVKDPKRLRKAFGKARKVRNPQERFKVLGTPGVIITTAGMLNGGPITHYIKRLHKRENCSLYISGYQVEGTVGRTLMDTGRYVNEGLDVKPLLDVRFRDWSAHAGRTGILNFVRKVRPKKTIFCHGSWTQEFAREVTDLGFPAFAPANGDRFTV